MRKSWQPRHDLVFLQVQTDGTFYRIVCAACGGAFEFPADGAGMVAPCPHCNSLVTLKRPASRRWFFTVGIVALVVCASTIAFFALRASRQAAAEAKEADAVVTSDDPEVLNTEAFKYARGEGRRKEEAKAFQLWTKAAEKGDSRSQYNLGLCYLDGVGVSKDIQTALRWIQKSAEAHLPVAEYQMGLLLSDGVGLPKDPLKAIEWYLKAAEQGFPPAYGNLGYCYAQGLGVSQSVFESTYWYRKAAERGNFIGMFSFGLRLKHGQGTQQDLTEAYKWLLLARASGATNSDYTAPQPNAPTCKEQIEKAFVELNGQLSKDQIEDAKQRASRFFPATQTTGPRLEQELAIELKESSGLIRVTLERVLIGQRTVDREVYHQFQLDEERRRGREIIYFQIAVKNLSNVNDFDLSHFGFTLRDDKGNSYSVEQTRDYLRGKAFPGDSVRGGIAFAVQQGCTPIQLIYDPGLVSYVPGFRDITQQRVLAHTADLIGLEIFKRPLEKR